MKQNSFFIAWMQRSTLLLAIIFAFSFTASAQANYWSIFGSSGCSGTDQYQMNAAISAPTSTSFLGIDPLLDFHVTSSAFTAANSVYTGNGQLLFSVDNNGIYDKTGTSVWDFNSSLQAHTYTFAGAAISEICAFPLTTNPNNSSYWVVFWANWASYSLGCSCQNKMLRAIRVDIDATTGLPSVNYLNDVQLTDVTSTTYGLNLSSNPFSFAIAADASPCGGSRNVYTLDGVGTGGCNGTNLRKWTFDASGNPPLSTTPSLLAYTTYPTIYPVVSPKAKILTIAGNKYLAFISTTNNCSASGIDWPNIVAMWNLAAPYNLDATTYSIGGTNAITGFEHVSKTTGGTTTDYLYLSVSNYYESLTATSYSFVPASSGLAYFNITTPSYTPPDGTTSNYSYTDLEADKAGNLMMVNSSNSSLAYLPNSSFGASAAPTLITSGCSTSGSPQYYSVSNYMNTYYQQNSAGGISFPIPYYLGKQIVGENYNNWGGAPYTVTASESWTATSNPFGTSATVNMDGIIIPAGCSLTITGMTLQNAPGSNITVEPGTISGTTMMTPGGRLILNNTTLTNNPAGCSVSGSGLWGGVIVYGLPSYMQNGGSGTPQGMLTMNPGSTISYAQKGVSLGTVELVHTFLGTLPVPAGTGGICQAVNSNFTNNSIGVEFLNYQNIPFISTTELNNLSYFNQCTFSSTDPASVTGTTLYDVYGVGVKGIAFAGCNFSNNIPSFTGTSYGIFASDMGFTVEAYSSPTGLVLHPTVTPSTISNFTYGIYHNNSATASRTATITNSVFTNNTIGIDLNSSVSPLVVGNTFKLPNATSVPAGPLYPLSSPIQSIGLLLNAASLFTVYSNTFQRSSLLLPGSPNTTVGVLAINTQIGSQDDNEINNNSYSGLGAANLANYINCSSSSPNALTHGLWYKCNTNSNNLFDITTLGNDPLNDGIRSYQGYPVGSGYASYPAGLPAGNTFTSSSSPSVFNLYNDGNCIPFTYYYSPVSMGGALTEQPGTLNTAHNFPTGLSESPVINTADQCALPGTGLNHGPGPILYTNFHIGHRLMLPPQGSSPDLVYLYTLNNINYYLTDEEGVKHRDQLYYWVSQLHTAAGDLLLANLLVEDGLTDLANIAYDAIPFTHSLDSMETLEFIQGRKLMDIIISNRIHHPENILALDPDQVRTLHGIAANAYTWAHVRAEGWLYQHDGTPFTDSLLFPVAPPPPPPGPKGEIAITEISNGPSGNCEYAEMIVANCGTDTAQNVDISGWIIDDNAGNFNTHGCGISNLSTSIGHYRLAKTGFWNNIPVGSIIVMYNHDDNCYNLPGLLVDTTGLVYCIPIGGTVLDPYGNPPVERYLTLPNLLQCAYCTDDYHIPYVPASDWVGTIGLDNAGDAIQVRCPGCDSANPSGAAFYHGIGYGPSSGPDAFASIAVGDNNLGGAVINGSGAGSKYVFNGSAAADLGDPTMWTKSTANEAGSRPISLGKVNDAFMSAVTSHTLDLPCCGGGGGSALRGGGGSPSVPAINNNGDISVYPNPANTTLYFQFPASGTVTIRLVDVSGQLMSEQVVNNVGTASINVNDYVPGIYLYQVITDTKTQSGKVLIGR